MAERQPAKYGTIEFDVTKVSDSVQRDLEINRYANRDGADIRDRGAQPRKTTCNIVFFPRAPVKGEQGKSTLAHTERFRLFFVESMLGRPLEFVHPHGGGYRARIESLNWEVDYSAYDEMIECSAVFIEDSTNVSPIIVSGARPHSSGLSAAKVAIDNAKVSFEELPLPPDTGFLDTVETEIAVWKARPDVLLDITARLGRLIRLIETTGNKVLSVSVDDFQARVSLEYVADAIRSAAEGVRQKQPQFRETEIERDQPLRRFVLTAYDATEAAERFDEILAVNDIRDPGFIRAGTTLLIPVANISPKITLRSAHR